MNNLPLRLVILGTPRTKKNSQQIFKRGNGKGFFIAPSKDYKKYEEDAIKQIHYDGEPISCPVNICCMYYMPTKRKVDLTNLLEATDDVLVKAGVLADDNSDIIVSHDGSRVHKGYKHCPRVELIIREVHSDGTGN